MEEDGEEVEGEGREGRVVPRQPRQHLLEIMVL